MLCACASTGAGTPTRVAVTPPAWATATPVDADTTGVLVRALSGRPGLDLDDPRRAADALALRGAACVADLPCVREVGRGLEVDEVVLLRLARLGDTVLVRMTLVDVAGAMREDTRQEVVQGATAERVERSVGRLAADLARSVAPDPSERLARRWWVWTLSGTALVAVTVLTAWAATRGDGGNGPDVVITPP